MKIKVAVIGCGLVGKTIAHDLAQDFNVVAIDRSNEIITKLNSEGISAICGDVMNEEFLAKSLKNIEFVALAVPGFLGYTVLSSLLKLGKKVVDISFFPENGKELSTLATKHNTWAIYDCGVAPGYSHLAAGAFANKGLMEFNCFVGGLPVERVLPFEYKAPFSPVDVLEEYTRPARYKVNGVIQTSEPLEMLEQLDFENIGTLEAFISDGLRSLLYTLPNTPNMIEKTLRYPGHANKIKLLKEIGLLNETKQKMNKTEIAPIEVTGSLLIKDWELTDKDDEFTLMRLELMGNDWQKEITLFDAREPKTGFSSMARTTGYTCSAMLRFLIENEWKETGVFAPEEIAMTTNCFEEITEELKAKGISIIIE